MNYFDLIDNPTDTSPKPLALLAPVVIALVAMLLIFVTLNAATTTPPDGDEATRTMLQRRCAMPVQMMTVRVEDPYTGQPTTITRAVCSQTKQPEVIND